MVPARAEETGADADGATSLTDTTPLAVAAKSDIRVLPARSGSPSEVDATTTPYAPSTVPRRLRGRRRSRHDHRRRSASVAAMPHARTCPGRTSCSSPPWTLATPRHTRGVNVTTRCSHVPRPTPWRGGPPARPARDAALPAAHARRRAPAAIMDGRARAGRCGHRGRASSPRATSRIRPGWTPRSWKRAGTPPRLAVTTAPEPARRSRASPRAVVAVELSDPVEHCDPRGRRASSETGWVDRTGGR